MKNYKYLLIALVLVSFPLITNAVNLDGIPTGFTFTKNLYYGMVDTDVVYLKIILTQEDCLSGATNEFFGSKTKAGVQCFQQKYKDEISEIAGYTISGTGFVGSATREYLNTIIAGGGDNTPPTSTCTSFTYSAWSACSSSGIKTRSVASSFPSGCQGGSPVLSQSCIYTSSCTESDWTSQIIPTTCPSSGQQTKVWNKIGNCTGGVAHPASEEITCGYQAQTCTSFAYSAWSACSSFGTQTRSVTASYPAGCQEGSPVMMQSCTYIPSTSTCTSFTYSAWSACSFSGTQIRSVTNSYPSSCQGGSPVLSQSCTYTPPVSNGLSVSLDTTTPVSTTFNTIEASANKDTPFSKVRLSAGSSNVAINSLTIVMKYDGLTGTIIEATGTVPLYKSYYLANLKVFDGSTQLGQTIAGRENTYFSNNFSSFDVVYYQKSQITGGQKTGIANGTYYYATISISPALTIPANTSKVLSLTSDLWRFPNGGSIPIQLGISAIGTTSSKAGLPIYGQRISLFPVTPVLSVALGSSGPREATVSGVVWAVLGSFRFTNNASGFSSVYIQQLKLKKLGTMSDSAIKSIYLKITSGSNYSQYTTPAKTSNIVDSSGYITFTPTSQSASGIISVAPYSYTDVKVEAVLSGDVGKTIGLGINSASDISSNATIQGTTFPLNGPLLTRTLVQVENSNQTAGIFSRIGEWFISLFSK